MRRSGRDSRAVLGLALAGAFLAGAAGGQERAAGPVIASIDVRVDGGELSPNLLVLVPLAAGEPYSAKRVDEAVKQVFRSGLFADVRVSREGETEVRLTFILVRKLMTRELTFSGDPVVSRRDLLAGLYALRAETDFSEARMERAAGEVRDVLRRNGYLQAEVRPASAPDPAGPRVDVDFAISAGPRFTVSGVDLRGGTTGELTKLRSLMEIKPGRPYIPAALEADLGRIKGHYNSLGYPRAEVAVLNRVFHETSATIDLVLRVVPNERVRVEIRGADVPDSLVRPIWEESIFEDWGLAQGEAAILTALRKKGYVFAAVRSSVERSPDELRVVHEVTPGPRHRVARVVLEGRRSLAESEVRAALGLAPRFPLFGGPAGDRLFEIPAQIEKLYAAQGFPEARAALNFRTDRGELQAVFAIEEGPRQTVAGVVFRGAALVREDELRTQVASREGGPFAALQVRRDAERLETYYLDRGVRGTRIAAAAEPAGEGAFRVVFDIQEGRLTVIDKVVVAGHVVTRPSLIERELLVRAGEPARAGAILESRRKLEKLGIFAEVRIEEVPAGEGIETLIVSVREGERNYAGAGLGLETKNEPMTSSVWNTVLRPRFTAEFIRSNMLGRAAQLSLVGQFSLKEKRAVASWEEPTFFGLPYQASFNVWLEREERLSYGFDRRGVSLSGIRTIDRDWTSVTTFRWADTTLYFLEVAESEVDRQFQPFSATTLSESVIWDRRDDPFNPTRGHFFSAVLEWAYPFFNAESDYLKNFVKSQVFLPLSDRLGFMVMGRAGLAMGRVPIHERFFAGGSGSFRGASFDNLGPKDPSSGRPVGGKAIVLFNFELKAAPFGALPALALAVFYDKGSVFAHRQDISLSGLEDALGLGLRYRTPLGPLRLDLGWNLRPGDGRAKPFLFVTIGDVF